LPVALAKATTEPGGAWLAARLLATPTTTSPFGLSAGTSSNAPAPITDGSTACPAIESLPGTAVSSRVMRPGLSGDSTVVSDAR
jgi:hypothetical protein